VEKTLKSKCLTRTYKKTIGNPERGARKTLRRDGCALQDLRPRVPAEQPQTQAQARISEAASHQEGPEASCTATRKGPQILVTLARQWSSSRALDAGWAKLSAPDLGNSVARRPVRAPSTCAAASKAEHGCRGRVSRALDMCHTCSTPRDGGGGHSDAV